MELELATTTFKLIPKPTVSPHKLLLPHRISSSSKNHLTAAVCKIGNFYPRQQSIPLGIIPIRQIALPQQNYVQDLVFLSHPMLRMTRNN